MKIFLILGLGQYSKVWVEAKGSAQMQTFKFETLGFLHLFDKHFCFITNDNFLVFC